MNYGKLTCTTCDNGLRFVGRQGRLAIAQCVADPDHLHEIAECSTCGGPAVLPDRQCQDCIDSDQCDPERAVSEAEAREDR